VVFLPRFVHNCDSGAVKKFQGLGAISCNNEAVSHSSAPAGIIIIFHSRDYFPQQHLPDRNNNNGCSSATGEEKRTKNASPATAPKSKREIPPHTSGASRPLMGKDQSLGNQSFVR